MTPNNIYNVSLMTVLRRPYDCYAGLMTVLCRPYDRVQVKRYPNILLSKLVVEFLSRRNSVALFVSVVQLVEHGTCNARIVGTIPGTPISKMYAHIVALD